MRFQRAAHTFAAVFCLATLFNSMAVQAHPDEEAIVGNWVGWAEPASQFQAPFDQVRFQVTFFDDGTAYWNDGHELRFGHGTGHGAWKKVGANGFESTFYWIAYDDTGANANGVANIFKLRFTGEIDPTTPNDITNSQLNLTIFPPGTDALDPADTGGIPVFGSFDIVNARRVVQSVPGLEDVSGDPAGEFVEGAWWGKAVPAADNLNPPFPEVVMMLTFTTGHNIVATDVFELAAPHVTAHGGNWIRTEDDRVHGTFVWTNMTAETDYTGYAKVRIFGDIDPDGIGDLDYMTGAVRPTGFATGADVLAVPDSPFSQFLGQFDIIELTRIKVDPDAPTTAGKDFSANLPTGAWIGTATADNPAASPFPELVIMPHFLPNGTIVWNDSQEHNLPHGTGFGDWQPTGADGNGMEMLGVLQKFDVNVPNNFGGVIKVKYTGLVDAADPNEMTGSFELIEFPAAAIPLPSPDRNKVFHRDPADTGGTSLGIFSYTINRIEVQELPGPIVEPPAPGEIEGHDYLHSNELVGNWVGWAVPENLFQAPFDQVRFQATFFEDGTAYWNDGHELRFGHGTGHGAWERIGETGFKSTFLWLAYDDTGENADGVANVFKLQFTGEINAPLSNGTSALDDISSGKLKLSIFPPGTDPLDPNEVGGIPVFGAFDVVDARRVKQSVPDLTDVSGDPAGEFVEGAWWGKAVPAPDNLNPPFPEVVMMLTFTRGHNIIATDVFELAAPHVTAHGGPWIRLADDSVHGTFVWTNMTADSDYDGYAKVRIVGNIDPDGTGDTDFMTGSVRPSGFATGADVLSIPDSPFGAFLGQFDILELTRIKVDPTAPATPGQDHSASLPSGAWIGKAVADNPALSPFTEIVIMPHFLPDGNIVWNDSQEHSYPHGTGFGNWEPTGDDGNGIKMLGVAQKFDVAVPNNFGGMIKIKYNGQVDPSDPNSMTGSFELVDYSAEAIPLPSPDRSKVFHRDPTDAGGVSLGTFTITELRRITASVGSGIVSASTDPTFNVQTGLFEQTVTVTNNSSNPVNGFQLDISDLPEGMTVRNANVEPSSIYFAGVFSVGEDVELVVEYYSTTSRDTFDPTLFVNMGTAPNPPGFDQGLAITRTFFDQDGGLVLEFTSTPGSSYYIQYSEDGMDWNTILPAVEANNTRTQWKDSGPPKTPVHPANNPNRFYRVVEQ